MSSNVNRRYQSIPTGLLFSWMPFSVLYRVHAVSNPTDYKKKLNSKIAADLVGEADDLFNENKYKELHELLLPYKEYDDVEILWRLSRVLYKISKQTASKEERKKLILESYSLIEKALNIDDNHYAVHKWYAILVDERAACDGIRARISQLRTVKRHMLRATELNPNDATTFHMLGIWCFNIASLPWYQRKIAAAIFGRPPVSCFEEAAYFFTRAEEIEPNFYSLNLLMLGKTLINLEREDEARYYLKLAANYPAHSDDDLQAKKEADELLKNMEK